MLRQGADLVLVSELLGHATLEATRIYTKPSAADRERAVGLAAQRPMTDPGRYGVAMTEDKVGTLSVLALRVWHDLPSLIRVDPAVPARRLARFRRARAQWPGSYLSLDLGQGAGEREGIAGYLDARSVGGVLTITQMGTSSRIW
jgi:hypothetical protein